MDLFNRFGTLVVFAFVLANVCACKIANSKFPLSTAKTSVVDERLLGDWYVDAKSKHLLADARKLRPKELPEQTDAQANEEIQQYLKLFDNHPAVRIARDPKKENTIVATFYFASTQGIAANDNPKYQLNPCRCFVYTTKIGERCYASISAIDQDFDVGDGCRLIRYEITEDEVLRTANLNAFVVSEAIRSGALKGIASKAEDGGGPHVTKGPYGQLVLDEYRIESPTDDLRAYVEKHDDELFRDRGQSAFPFIHLLQLVRKKVEDEPADKK